jgi:hypothetical protein
MQPYPPLPPAEHLSGERSQALGATHGIRVREIRAPLRLGLLIRSHCLVCDQVVGVGQLEFVVGTEEFGFNLPENIINSKPGHNLIS